MAACDVQNRPKTQFAGPLTPATDPDHCPPSRGTLIIQRGQVLFTPTDGTWTLEGAINGTAVTATRARITSDHKSFKTDLDAKLSETEIRGTYTTPTCTYQVTLQKF